MGHGHRHRPEQAAKMKPNDEYANIFLHFFLFYFVFVAFSAAQFAAGAGAGERWRMSSNDREVELDADICLYLSHLCLWKMKLFSVFCINFLIRRICDSEHMGKWATATREKKIETLHWLAGWLLDGDDMVKRKCKCRQALALSLPHLLCTGGWMSLHECGDEKWKCCDYTNINKVLHANKFSRRHCDRRVWRDALGGFGALINAATTEFGTFHGFAAVQKAISFCERTRHREATDRHNVVARPYVGRSAHTHM